MSLATPGPWTANLDSDHGDFTIWGPEPDDAFLANVGTAPQEDRIVAFDVAEANAHLIAKAPALLAENERLSQRCRGMEEQLYRISMGQPRFENVWCSQCGRDFGPGNQGFSHCESHRTKEAVTA